MDYGYSGRPEYVPRTSRCGCVLKVAFMDKAIRFCYFNYRMLLEIHQVFKDFHTKYS